MGMNKYRHKDDRNVYDRFVNPKKYRDDIVKSAQDLKEYSLTKENWTSLKEYDQASLAYVTNGGKIPWTPIEVACNVHLDKEMRVLRNGLKKRNA